MPEEVLFPVLVVLRLGPEVVAVGEAPLVLVGPHVPLQAAQALGHGVVGGGDVAHANGLRPAVVQVAVDPARAMRGSSE